MRGLTVLERALLAEADNEYPNLDGPQVPDGSVAVFRRLISDGRVHVLRAGGDDWLASTDLGRLALRVCPVEDF